MRKRNLHKYQEIDGVTFHEARSRGFLGTIGKAINASIIPNLKSNDLLYAKIVSDWKYIVGSDIAARTHPEKISFTKYTDGVLYLSIDHAASLEISYKTHEIATKINEYCGRKIIKRVICRCASIYKPNITEKIKCVQTEIHEPSINIEMENPALQNALSGLATAMSKKA